jgi:hypothetical protein
MTANHFVYLNENFELLYLNINLKRKKAREVVVRFTGIEIGSIIDHRYCRIVTLSDVLIFLSHIIWVTALY